VRSLVAEQGGDITGYEGWENVCLARSEDHPSSMAAEALGTALNEARISASDLRFVVSAGVSRDYPPSWSMATEVMRLHRTINSCFGFDMTIGCLGTLAALNVTLGWLAACGSGYAAVVCAERWAHTIDRSNNASKRIWSHGDAGSALVVGFGAPGRALAEFHGAVFSSHTNLNGHLLVKYGGTRHPVAPPGENPYTRQLGPTPAKQVWESYETGYSQTFLAFQERFKVVPDRLICNQISPKIVRMISQVTQVPYERTIETGHETGHLGGSDIVVGLRRLLDAKSIDGPVAIMGSVPYAFGAGLLLPPA
jgi:3-oxoacyl-[acyl-carrier-protein] synthase III